MFNFRSNIVNHKLTQLPLSVPPPSSAPPGLRPREEKGGGEDKEEEEEGEGALAGGPHGEAVSKGEKVIFELQLRQMERLLSFPTE